MVLESEVRRLTTSPHNGRLGSGKAAARALASGHDEVCFWNPSAIFITSALDRRVLRCPSTLLLPLDSLFAARRTSSLPGIPRGLAWHTDLRHLQWPTPQPASAAGGRPR